MRYGLTFVVIVSHQVKPIYNRKDFFFLFLRPDCRNALTLHDAFISCWQEKYFSDRIRPESAINILHDPSWRPLLQTPPFPEYTSGHSVASSSVAVVLTYLLGDNFSFVDTSEIYFGLPEREFKSFYQASDEAAVSRLYGGIHFRDACDNGVAQGKQVGQFVLSSLFDVQAKQ